MEIRVGLGMNSGLTRCIVGLKWAIDTEIYGGISKKTKEFKNKKKNTLANYKKRNV